MLIFPFYNQLSTIGAIPHLNSFYGSVGGPIWLDSVGCTGRESRILNCVHSGVGSISSVCDNADHSGVECPGSYGIMDFDPTMSKY